MKALKEYLAALFDRDLMPMALKVAGIIGTILFIINHGAALIGGRMTSTRWVSGVLTYLVPYCVNIHGQYINRRRQRKRKR